MQLQTISWCFKSHCPFNKEELWCFESVPFQACRYWLWNFRFWCSFPLNPSSRSILEPDHPTCFMFDPDPGECKCAKIQVTFPPFLPNIYPLHFTNATLLFPRGERCWEIRKLRSHNLEVLLSFSCVAADVWKGRGFQEHEPGKRRPRCYWERKLFPFPSRAVSRLNSLPLPIRTPATQAMLSGAPNVNFRKISVQKTIWDLEFSEHFL